MTSRPTLAGAVLCGWLMTAAPAAAEPFQTFLDMCLATNADRDAAGARAKAAGWTSMAISPDAGGELGLEDPILFLEEEPADMAKAGAFQALLTGWGDGVDIFGVAGVRMDVCAIVADIGELESFRSRLSETLGLSPMKSDAELEMWPFSRSGSGFRSESDLMLIDVKDVQRAARERKIYVASIVPAGDTLALMIGALRSQP